VIDGRDRHRVERLCRYLARPPTQERLVEIAGRKTDAQHVESL